MQPGALIYIYSICRIKMTVILIWYNYKSLIYIHVISNMLSQINPRTTISQTHEYHHKNIKLSHFLLENENNCLPESIFKFFSDITFVTSEICSAASFSPRMVTIYLFFL